MREVTPLIAFCSDLHLWDKPPVARSGEPDWWEAMKRPLDQLRDIARDIPIVYAGDIFDRPKASPELINWAIEYLPEGFGIPGQHDLPYHNYEDIRKSAYWTLCEAGVIKNFEAGCPNYLSHDFGGPRIEVGAFPWGYDVVPNNEREKGVIHIAVVHAYIWTANCGYPGCPESAKLDAWTERLRGYDVAVFGDNHIGFLGRAGSCRVVNCGTLMRRHSSEAELIPVINVLNSDLSITTHTLDTSRDVIDCKAPEVSPESVQADFGQFLAGLKSLADAPHDFRAAMIRHMDGEGLEPSVRRLILQAMGQGGD